MWNPSPEEARRFFDADYMTRRNPTPEKRPRKSGPPQGASQGMAVFGEANLSGAGHRFVGAWNDLHKDPAAENRAAVYEAVRDLARVVGLL